MAVTNLKTGKTQVGMTICLTALRCGYFVKDFAIHSLLRKRFRFCQAPSLLRQFDNANKKEDENKNIETSRHSSWFSH